MGSLGCGEVERIQVLMGVALEEILRCHLPFYVQLPVTVRSASSSVIHSNQVILSHHSPKAKSQRSIKSKAAKSTLSLLGFGGGGGFGIFKFRTSFHLFS